MKDAMDKCTRNNWIVVSGVGGWHGLVLQAVVSMFILLALQTGCKHVYADMFTDEFANKAPVQTQSSQRAIESPGTPSKLSRGYQLSSVSAADGTVTHGPLYFEDPFETRGSRDGKFAWTFEDYFALGYSDARWLINVAVMEVSFLLPTPVAQMETGADGVAKNSELRIKNNELGMGSRDQGSGRK